MSKPATPLSAPLPTLVIVSEVAGAILIACALLAARWMVGN